MKNTSISLRKAKNIPERRWHLSWSLNKKDHSATWSEQKWNFSRGNNLIPGSSVHVSASMTGLLDGKPSRLPRNQRQDFKCRRGTDDCGSLVSCKWVRVMIMFFKRQEFFEGFYFFIFQLNFLYQIDLYIKYICQRRLSFSFADFLKALTTWEQLKYTF